VKYNLANPAESKQAREYLTELITKRARVEIKKIIRKRSLNQNNYLHLLLGYFGQHFGYTLEESKLIYKELNAGTYAYEKNGYTFLKSSAVLDTAQMTRTIDIFRERSKDMGLPLPAATDQDWLRQIENEIERSGQYV